MSNSTADAVCMCIQWTNATIPNLLYNSEYFFDVEYEADRAKQSAHVTLLTPGCHALIDDSFKRCSHLGPPLTGACSVNLVMSSPFVSFVGLLCATTRPQLLLLRYMQDFYELHVDVYM